jgi:hypothetical protein
MSILLGTQPTLRHVPPIWSLSTTATLKPLSTAAEATSMPEPVPTTSTSKRSIKKPSLLQRKEVRQINLSITPAPYVLIIFLFCSPNSLNVVIVMAKKMKPEEEKKKKEYYVKKEKKAEDVKKKK